MGWLTGRRRVVVALGAVCAVLWAVVAVVVLRRDDEPASERADAGVDPQEVLDERQVEMLQQAVPDPGCAREPDAPPDDESLVALDVMWLEGTCLLTRTEYVAEGEVDARRRELAEDPAVVVAGLSPPVSPDWVGEADRPGDVERAGQTGEDDRRDEQWALDELVPGDESALPWPGGRGGVVAVLDTGVHAPHGDLEDAVIGRRHYPGESELDPDGHGTHVAGIVAARRGNGGIVGVAPEVSILDVPVELERPDRVLNRGAGVWSGLVWAVNSGATVANLSFSGQLAAYEANGTLEVAAAAVEFARGHDVVVVTGAGNCGPDPEDFEVEENGLLPGCLQADERRMPAMLGDAVVAVGAVLEDDDQLRLAGYSTSNGDVDLVAPGNENVSTYPPGKDGAEEGRLGWYRTIGATSQAAPHVAGAVAIAQSENPTATADQIVQALLDSADPERLRDERSDPGVGAGFLEIVGLLDELRTVMTPPPDDVADRTQAAFVREGTLYAFDGTRAHPVRRADPEAPVTWIDWSDDHTWLVGLAGSTLFSWFGPGTEPVEAPYEPPCDACGPSLAYLDSDNLVVSLDDDGTLTRYDAASLQEVDTIALSFPEDISGSRTLVGDVGGRLVVHESGGAHASERLWLVDPEPGEAQEFLDMTGLVQGRVAVNAGDDRIALVAGYSSCSSDNQVYVLDGEDLGEIADVGTPSDATNPTGMAVDELFFNGDVLYATMTYRSSGGPGPCEAGSAGVWRLDGDTWEQVRSEPLTNARPLEGRSGDEPTGWITIEADGQGSLRPMRTEDISLGDLGILEPGLWSTPTRTEIDFDSGHPVGDEDDQPPGGGAPGNEGDEGDEDDDEGGGGAPPTVEAAVDRFEEFVHALGAGDVATACAIGRPAVEAGGMGMSCEQAIPALREMSSEQELAALQEVDVDPSQAEQTAPDRVEIPPAYPYSTEPESDPPVILEHDGTNWFVVQ